MESKIKVQLFMNGRGRWQVRLRHVNSEILAHSEEYFSRATAKRAAKNLSLKLRIPLETMTKAEAKAMRQPVEVDAT